VSISSTFYGRFLGRYFGAKNDKAETLGFVIFWRQNFVQKCVDEIDYRYHHIPGLGHHLPVSNL